MFGIVLKCKFMPYLEERGSLASMNKLSIGEVVKAPRAIWSPW